MDARFYNEQKQTHGEWKWVCLPKGENGEGDDDDEEDDALGKLGEPWLGLGNLHNGGKGMEEEEKMGREMWE